MARKPFSAAALPPANSGIARLLPVATTVLAALVTILPLRVPGDATLAPAFTLMAAYHWTIYRPDLLPSLALFGVGITEDLLAGGPADLARLGDVLDVAARAPEPRRRNLDDRVPVLVDRLVERDACDLAGTRSERVVHLVAELAAHDDVRGRRRERDCQRRGGCRGKGEPEAEAHGSRSA